MRLGQGSSLKRDKDKVQIREKTQRIMKTNISLHAAWSLFPIKDKKLTSTSKPTNFKLLKTSFIKNIWKTANKESGIKYVIISELLVIINWNQYYYKVLNEIYIYYLYLFRGIIIKWQQLSNLNWRISPVWSLSLKTIFKMMNRREWTLIWGTPIHKDWSYW